MDTAFVGFVLQSGGMHQDTTHVQSVGNHGQDSQKLILHYGEMRTSFILQCSDFYLDSLILYEQSAYILTMNAKNKLVILPYYKEG